MRIMLVTYRFGRDIPGGGERYLRELMIRLAASGHQVDVYTTRSQRMIRSPFGHLVWDNFLPPGVEDDEGVAIHRCKVLNPRPGRARRMMRSLMELQDKERESQEFSLLMAEALEGVREHCFLSGWHNQEIWEDGPARWTMRNANLVVGSVGGIHRITLEAYSYLAGHLVVEIPGRGSWEFELEKGRPRELHLEFNAADSVAVHLMTPRTARPSEDAREVGMAVRRVAVAGDGEERELDLSRGWREFLETGPETVVGSVLWSTAERRTRRASRWHHYVMGPRSPQLEKEVMAAAHGCDLVFGSMVPMCTMDLAWRAARQAGKPFVAFPLFHARDPNHYWAHFKEALENAEGVEANSPVIEELMSGWGFKAFAVGPGYNLEEFSSPGIDGARFRAEFGFGSEPILLWVGRKNIYKGYREAIAALHQVRRKGIKAIMVMVGPDEDNLPVSEEGVYYLGTLPREKVLDAFDACDLFILPSLHESFCLVFCEAWLRGKPVLGNAYCAAARGLIEHGGNGYLCVDARDYGRRALELLSEPEKAREMGDRGRGMVLSTRGWERLIEELEERLEEIASPES